MSPNITKKVVLSVLLALAFTPGVTQAAWMSPTSASTSGGTNGSTSLLIDGNIPVEGTQWQTGTVWWNGTGPVLTFDLGALYNLTDILISVDNNDQYQVDYSTNGSSYSSLFTIFAGFGEIGGGMDTMTTKSGDPEFVAGIDFTAVQARYLRVYATGGDNSYSVGELQFEGTLANTTPAPPSVVLLSVGALGAIGYRRWRGAAPTAA